MGISDERRIGHLPPAATGNPVVDAARKRQFLQIEAHRATRRMHLADDVWLLWESETTIDHDTAELLWDDQDPESRAAIHAEQAARTPGPHRPVATLGVTAPDAASMQARLVSYAGLEHAVFISDGKHRIPAQVLGDHAGPAATSELTYLAFELPTDFDTTTATLRIDHPRLRGRWPVPGIAFQT